MAFFVTKTDKENLAETKSGNNGGSKYINKSGIYDVTIKYISVVTNDSGANSLNFTIDYNGTEQVLWGLRLQNNNGSENFGAKIFNKLCIVAGIDAVSEPETETHNVGKEQRPMEFQVLTDFSDLDVKVRIQYSYSKWNGQIRENADIKGFYRAEDGAAASEILNDTEVGAQLEKDMKYADNVTYRDGLTAEDISEWIKEKSKKGGAVRTPIKPKTENVVANKFAGANSPF